MRVVTNGANGDTGFERAFPPLTSQLPQDQSVSGARNPDTRGIQRKKKLFR